MHRWLSITVVIIVALVALNVGLRLSSAGCSFDRERWQEAREMKDPFERYDGLGDDLEALMTCDEPVGASRRTIANMLGRRDGSSARRWYYNVGIPDTILSDYPDLTVSFDRAGRVVDATVPGYDSPG